MKLNKVLKVTFIAIGFMLLSFGHSFALLSPLSQNVLLDTTSQLSIEWTFNGPGPATSTYLSDNWQANFIITPVGTGLEFVINGFQHILGPHPDDQKPGPYNYVYTGLFSGGPAISLLGDLPHPLTDGGAHNDHWTFTFDGTTADLTVTHTPIPPSLLLLSSGLLGLIGIGRKKLFVND